MIEDGSGGTGQSAVWWRGLFGALAIASFALGVVGFSWYLPVGRPEMGRTLADVVYYALQLFVLGPDPLDKGGPLNVPLEVARFGAPAVTAFTVFEAFRVLLRERWARWTTARRKGHVVVCGDGPAGLLLACNIRDSGREVVLVGLAINEVARRRDLRVVTADPRDVGTLRAAGAPRAAVVFATGHTSASNLAVVLGARQLARGNLAAYAQVRDDELVDALQTHQVALDGRVGAALGFFSFDDVAARVLLGQESALCSGEDAEVVIFGFGPFGQALLRAIGRRHDDATAGHARITVVTDQPPDVEAFSREWGLSARGIQVTGCAVLPARRESVAAAMRRTYVCLEDEDRALNVALHQVRTQQDPVVLCLPQKSTFEEALTRGDVRGSVVHGYAPLRLFGILDAACQPELLTNDVLGVLARAIHERYRQTGMALGDTSATNRSLVPWCELPRHLKESNYAQAEHIHVKLASIGCVIGPATTAVAPFEYRDQEVEQLARMEHQRWMNERLAAGFRYGPVRQGNRHPDLVEWDLLSEHSRRKDIDVARELPELLASVGLRIFRHA